MLILVPSTELNVDSVLKVLNLFIKASYKSFKWVIEIKSLLLVSACLLIFCLFIKDILVVTCCWVLFNLVFNKWYNRPSVNDDFLE